MKFAKVMMYLARSTESQKKYIVDSEWHSNTQLRQTIEFAIQVSNMSVCKSLKESIVTRCRLSNFEIHYALEGQQTAARTIEVTTTHVTNTAMYNKIKSQFPSNNQDTFALTGNDYKNLLSETMDQITMNIRVEEGYESIQDPIGIDQMLDRQLKFNQVQLTRVHDNIWDSLYWTPELTRPDRLSKVLNKVMKQDAIDSDKFHYDYSQADEALKETLKFDDRQKMDNLEKQLAPQSRNTAQISDVNTRFGDKSGGNFLHLVSGSNGFDTGVGFDNQNMDRNNSSNDHIIHYIMDTERYNDTKNERKNGTTILLQRKDAKKLVQYLSEHVEVNGDIIKPKPIDVTLVKFGSLKSNTKLFSNTVHVKTRMNVHILPLRCPYKYSHRSSATWLEEAHYRLSSVVDNLTNIIDDKYSRLSNSVDTKYDRLLNTVNNLTNIIDDKYDRLLNLMNNSTNIFDSKLNRLSNVVDNFRLVASALHVKLMADFDITIDKFKTSQNQQFTILMSAMQISLIQKIEKNQGVTNSTINETAKYLYEKIIGKIATNNEPINSTSTQKLNALDEKITNNNYALRALLTNEVSKLITNHSFPLDPSDNLYRLAKASIVESIHIVQHSPLMVKVQSTNGWWFQGMVCDDNFDLNSAMVACRSSNAAVRTANFSSIAWQQDNRCEYGFGPQGRIFMKYKCNFILDNIVCDSNAYSSLAHCRFLPIFEHNCGTVEHVNLVCT